MACTNAYLLLNSCERFINILFSKMRSVVIVYKLIWIYDRPGRDRFVQLNPAIADMRHCEYGGCHFWGPLGPHIPFGDPIPKSA